MKFLVLALLSFSVFADHEATCVVGNHNSQRFRGVGFTGDEACQEARLQCERETRMVCFEIDREEGFGDFDYGYDDYGYDDGGGYGNYNDDGYDDWDVINGHRVNQIVCKVPIIGGRNGRSIITKQGDSPREACQKALRACQRQIGPYERCGRPQVTRNYRR